MRYKVLTQRDDFSVAYFMDRRSLCREVVRLSGWRTLSPPLQSPQTYPYCSATTKANRWVRITDRRDQTELRQGDRQVGELRTRVSCVMSDTHKVSKGLEVLIDNQPWQKGWIG